MSTPLLPSFRRQQLVLDFSTLRGHCPEGIYLSLTPGHPSIWGGIFFVRKGPYAEAILRFQISFPDSYPTNPPLVTFSTDVFHPLVVPLTTYTFSANAVASSGVSASDDDRLPPGTFSLQYGFPQWFRQTGQVAGEDGQNKNAERAQSHTQDQAEETETANSQAEKMDDNKHVETTNQPVFDIRDRKGTLLNVLRHVHTAFSDEMMLDAIPLSAAGNPSAWHAWRAHRGLNPPKSPSTPDLDDLPITVASSPKHPGEWKWDGVWESRVDNAIRESISEGALFGSSASSRTPAGLPYGRNLADSPARGSKLDHRQMLQAMADRQIKFSKLSDENMAEVKSKIQISAGPGQA
ncbi:hypothetical protein B0A52_06007 [Exophiala mesophila]|uniref:UBC core domain-containing protein n=1 Tax=Exophiala mesophila TaxID=212818 RepID=A0A438N5E3_EXOME|nr:hypothetical protein B0A52_06007 [Exophiala mesophila]